MQEIIISKEDSPPIPANFFKGTDDKKLLVIVGGSGDNKDKFNVLIQLLKDANDWSIVTFTFRGLIASKLYSLNQQTQDLKDVLRYFKDELNLQEIAVVCTSMGAYSTANVLIDPEIEDYIYTAIFIDPADYYLKDGDRPEENYAWTGAVEYKPESETASELLKLINSDVKIHVINFTIRNRGPEGYPTSEQRGVDNPELFERLNNEMVKSFYFNAPEDNRGEYIEDNTIPHAFIRDGDINDNNLKVANYISQLLD